MKNPIAESNTFLTAVVPKELDSRARILAAKMRLTRSKLVGLALADYVSRLESDPRQVEGVKRERQRQPA